MKTYAVINQKGGVGKSTTALAIGAGLTQRGLSVLFVDLDAQANLSYTLGASTQGPGVMGVLQRIIEPMEAIQETKQGDILASSPSLAVADMALTETGKEYRLKEALKRLEGSYDYCIIDTPPALGILTVNALTACDKALITAQADIYSLQGIGQLHKTLETVREYCNPSLHIMGIVLTRFNGRTVISREVAALIEEAAGELSTKLYKARVRECTALKEAQAMKQDIFTYAPRSNAVKDYKALIEEILEEEEEGYGQKKV